MAKKENSDNKKQQRGGDPLYRTVGLVLVGVAILLLLQSARVTTAWYAWRMGSFFFPTGACVIPLLIGIGMFFYRPGWIATKVVLVVGVAFLLLTMLLSVRITFVGTSLFNYILMFGTLAGGVGFLARGFFSRPEK